MQSSLFILPREANTKKKYRKKCSKFQTKLFAGREMLKTEATNIKLLDR
jgi:hypothetical protein